MDGNSTFPLLEDLRSLKVSDSAVYVFVDETGHERLHDPTFPIFGFGGCLSFAVDYDIAIAKPWKEVEQTFPSEMLPLHASELNKEDMTPANYEALNTFFFKNVFGRFAAITTDKTINARPEYQTITYMTATIHKRILDLLRLILNDGLVFSEVIIIIEKSERTKYMVSQNFALYELQFMSHKIPIRHYFMTKEPNEPGLVVADFVAHTAGSTVKDTLMRKISAYLKRRDFKNIFIPQDARWVSFLKVDSVK